MGLRQARSVLTPRLRESMFALAPRPRGRITLKEKQLDGEQKTGRNLDKSYEKPSPGATSRVTPRGEDRRPSWPLARSFHYILLRESSWNFEMNRICVLSIEAIWQTTGHINV